MAAAIDMAGTNPADGPAARNETGLDDAMLAAASDRFDYDGTLRACAQQRIEALRDLYEHEADRLLGIAVRILRDRDLAEDVVHEVFIQVWRNAGTFNPRRGSGRAWLTTILRNRAFNVLRSRRRTEPLDPEALLDLPDCAEKPDEALERIDEGARLKLCLKQLDEMKRTSILLAYVDGLSQTQIAERLNTPHNTIKAWIRRGLLALRECLK